MLQPIKPVITSYGRLQAGVITAREIEVGQVVSAGQTVYQLAIDGDREVVIGVPEQLISTLKLVGLPVCACGQARKMFIRHMFGKFRPQLTQHELFVSRWHFHRHNRVFNWGKVRGCF